MTKQTIDSVSSHSSDIKLHDLRWWIIFFVAFDVLIVKIIHGSFGIVNNVYVEYFQKSYVTVDWFNFIQIPSSLIFSGLQLLFSMKHLSNRSLSVLFVGCLLFTCIRLLAAYCHAPLYALIFVGVLAIGFCVVGTDYFFPKFVTKWFSENQIGFALSIKEIFGATVHCWHFLFQEMS